MRPTQRPATCEISIKDSPILPHQQAADDNLLLLFTLSSYYGVHLIFLSRDEGEGEKRVSFPECSMGIEILSQWTGGWEFTHTDKHLDKGSNQIPRRSKSFKIFLLKEIPISPPNLAHILKVYFVNHVRF